MSHDSISESDASGTDIDSAVEKNLSQPCISQDEGPLEF